MTSFCACGSRKTQESKACNTCEFARRSAERVVRRTRTCVGCGRTFIKRPTGSNKGFYCSRECAWADPKWVSAAAERSRQRAGLTPEVLQRRLAEREAARVTKEAERAKQKAETVARRLADYPALLERKKAERYAKRVSRPERVCKGCGALYVPVQGQRQFCQDSCAARTQKRIEKRVRRARKKGNAYEPVDPVVVFKRDGWRCQLCGRKTSKRHSNTPDSPELDHIIPLALGGRHSYDNTQCACRACNGTKGARIVGQLRLCG